MRELAGLTLAHVMFIAVGLGALRGFGLVGRGWRSMILALGPALTLGVCVVVTSLIALLVVGVAFTLWTAVVVSAFWALLGAVAARRRGPAETATPHQSEIDRAPSLGPASAGRQLIVLLGLYAAYGAYALARLPTVIDDARIWSLKGLTLTYYDSLAPQMFDSSFVARAHPVYPLLQPVFEALLFRWIGHPALRWFHAELWIVCGAAMWTAAYLLSRTRLASLGMLAWLPVLAMLAAAPQVLLNLEVGYADTTASILLAAGALALGLWFERGDSGYLAVAALLLGGAANVKDEDFTGAVLVLIVAAVALLVRRTPGRLPRFGGAVAVVAALILPWRIWVSAHGLSDGVSPPLPRALNPIYVLGRLHELNLSATALVSQTLQGYGWLASVFIAICITCFRTGTARRITCFYLGASLAIVASLLWLYTTTPVRLGFLIPTSMDRTVSVFMVLAAFAGAHLVSMLVAAAGAEPPIAQQADARGRPDPPPPVSPSPASGH